MTYDISGIIFRKEFCHYPESAYLCRVRHRYVQELINKAKHLAKAIFL